MRTRDYPACGAVRMKSIGAPNGMSGSRSTLSSNDFMSRAKWKKTQVCMWGYSTGSRSLGSTSRLVTRGWHTAVRVSEEVALFDEAHFEVLPFEAVELVAVPEQEPVPVGPLLLI